jgi:hypothetical protein
MAAAKKSKKDIPPLKKSTIKKGHEIAKEIMAKEETEEVELTQEEIANIESILSDLEEARGRPRKDLGYTINPNNKEKLYHDNTAHMATLEKLQAKGTIPKPAIEPSLHIINQLRKASTSMSPHIVTFRNGEKHPVLGTHAAKILDKYASLKPSEKEAFQHMISGSHAAMKREI